jgi:hypothetical protein
MKMPEKPHLMDNGSSVMMGTKRYIKEHKNLIKVLDKCKAKKESAAQKKELMDIIKGGKGSKPVTKMRRDSAMSGCGCGCEDCA